ncbi:MAG TPA: methyl-accepting chemotaxis protein [Bacteroidota bacterium]|nr:methyl-accepting chemotaxis protein [Bacteroidota bacterium]
MRIWHARDWTLFGKITGVAIGATLPLLAVTVFYALPRAEQAMYGEKIQGTKHLVEITSTLVADYDARVHRGEFSLEEGQKRALARIQQLRYEQKEYFWINDMSPRMLMHPYRGDLVGKDLASYADPNGVRLFAAMVDVCREKGEGVVRYLWPKPGTETPEPKLSYVKSYAPWGWVIGSGVYVDDIEAEASGLRSGVLAGLGLAVAASIGVGAVVGRTLRRRLTSLSTRMEHADLNTRVEDDARDEIGMLTRTFDTFVRSLHDALVRVADSATAVASASAEITASTEEIATGAREQTGQATEVASAVEQMAKTTVETTRNATSTAGIARNAREAAEQGGTAVGETVGAMRRIADFVETSASTVQALGASSDRIGEIVSVIDDIADQTNLLALNAAIEAARAGDQGRGFAVVADEVRKLAERTTRATREIAEMISTIQADTRGAVASIGEGTRQVNEGIALADGAGASLRAIVANAQNLTDMITQIAAASEQQSAASEQISKNVEAISSVTGHTAAGAQQIASAAEDLNRLVENLQETLGLFHLEGPQQESHHGEPQLLGVHALRA